jgi:hypothetical protein
MALSYHPTRLAEPVLGLAKGKTQGLGTLLV